jgi:cobyrinic acid a,c-diamide synthase
VESESYPMVGVLPVVVEQTKTPQGHGYVEAQVDRKNPFLATSTRLLGHEFHYSRLIKGNQSLSTALKLKRGFGVGQGRDGIQESNVLASYTHIHALGVPGWGESVVKASCRGGAS